MPKSIEEIRRDSLAKLQTRAIVLNRDDVDEESRTVNVAFASDKPVEHWFGNLMLSMDKKAIRTERLASGAPLLMDHNRTDQVGVVENFSFDKDGMARADVRFSTSARGEEIFRDVQSGIRRNISVGFMMYALEFVSSKEGEPDLYRCDDWEPLEISIVSVPADISAGVGRSLDDLQTPEKVSNPSQSERAISTKEEKTMTPEEIAAAAAAEEARRAQELAAANSNPAIAVARQITEWGTILGEPELARTHAAMEGASVETFMAAVRAKQTPTVPVPPESAASVAARTGGQGAQLARSVSRVNLEAFKGEGAHERAYRSGMHLAAVLLKDERAITYCRENGIALTRTQTEGDNTKGGYTVLPEFEQTIFDLRLQYGVARRVCDVVPMGSDTKIVTRRTGGLTAYAVGPHTRGTYSDITDDQFELVARKWMVLNKREDELTEDSFISWADRLASESAYAFSYAEDNCLFNADGTSTYHGIVGITQKILGLSATRANIAGAVVASGNAWSEIVIGDLLSLVGKLPSFARVSGNVRWYCTSEFWATVLQRLALAAGGVTHAEMEGELRPVFLGKPVELVEAMQHVEANDTIPLLYGNLAQAATFGDRRGITVKTTDSNDTDFESDLEATKATERFDINVHDVGNQSATAADRRAGPVVALLTAAS